jgi:2-polyprenyl-3-methyl-5-hydroxy-6-metoxy-1,4-benzoquinol methylase
MIKDKRKLFDYITPIYGLFYESQKRKFIQMVNEISEFLIIEKGSKILDVGSGTGALVKAFNEQGYDSYGIEQSGNMVNFSIKKTGLAEAFKLGNILESEVKSESYDLVIATHVAHGLSQKQRMELYTKMYEISKKGFIIYDYNVNKHFIIDILESLEGSFYKDFVENVINELENLFEKIHIIKFSSHGNLYIVKKG